LRRRLTLTFCLLLLLPVPFGTAFADAVDDRDDCMLGPGDIDRAGTDGGGPGSAVAGDLR
jgi:hypothetical protein